MDHYKFRKKSLSISLLSLSNRSQKLEKRRFPRTRVNSHRIMNSSTQYLSQMFHKFHCPKFDWCATTAVGADVVVPFSVLQVHRRVQFRPRHPHKNVLAWENFFVIFSPKHTVQHSTTDFYCKFSCTRFLFVDEK